MNSKDKPIKIINLIKSDVNSNELGLNEVFNKFFGEFNTELFKKKDIEYIYYDFFETYQKDEQLLMEELQELGDKFLKELNLFFYDSYGDLNGFNQSKIIKLN